MKKMIITLLIVCFFAPGWVYAKKVRTDYNCLDVAVLKTDGTGDNRTKKRGGNYAAIKMDTLEPGKVIRVIGRSGNLNYVTLHGRYQGGIWRTIYKGPITEFPVSKYLMVQKRDKKCTHVIVSINGGHEKYEPIRCEAVVRVCDGKGGGKPGKDHRMEKGCRDAGTLKTDGYGNNRTKKRGGNYASIALNTLKPSEVIRVIRRSGTLKYVTLHGRYQGGIWRTIYQGPITEFPVSQYLSSQMKDTSCTNVVISVNGAHEKYEPIVCEAVVKVCGGKDGGKPGKDDRMEKGCRDAGTLKTDGSGNNRTKKRGGNYASIALNTLKPGEVIRVIRLSGTLKYVTLHGRYQGGIWRTIYQGPITEFPVSQYLASQMKDSRCTNVVISVNGAHEKYEPIVCEAVVKVCGGKDGGKSGKDDQMEKGCRDAGTLKTDGSGDNRTKKRGGNYASIALNTLKPGEVIRVIRQAGELKYVTLHGRYQGGIWRTIYQGPITEFPVGQYLASQMKDSRCTNVVISVNGAHEKYEPIVCEAVVKVCAGKGGPGPVSNIRDLMKKESRVALKAHNGMFFSALNGGGGEVVANRPASKEWETFTMVPLPGENKVAFKAQNGQFVCAESGGGRELVVNRPWSREWETFELVPMPGHNRVALKTYNGKFVTVDHGNGDKVTATSSQAGDRETFTIVTMN